MNRLDQLQHMIEKKASPEVLALQARLAALAPGEVVSYAELSQIAGGNIQKEKYHLLYAAKRRARDFNKVCTIPVCNEGVKRPNDTGTLEVSRGQVKRVRRAADRGIKITVCVDYCKLKPAERIKACTLSTIHQFVHRATSPSTLRALQRRAFEAKVDTKRVIPLKETLKLFVRDKSTDFDADVIWDKTGTGK